MTFRHPLLREAALRESEVAFWNLHFKYYPPLISVGILKDRARTRGSLVGCSQRKTYRGTILSVHPESEGLLNCVPQAPHCPTLIPALLQNIEKKHLLVRRMFWGSLGFQVLLTAVTPLEITQHPREADW